MEPNKYLVKLQIQMRTLRDFRLIYLNIIIINTNSYKSIVNRFSTPSMSEQFEFEWFSVTVTLS